MKGKLCGWAGCSRIIAEGYYCPEHKARAEANKKASAFKNAKRYADYSDPEWRKVSSAYLRKVGCCEKCGSRQFLQVHHIIPVRYAPQLFLDVSNFQVLCRSCHQVETQREIAERKRKNQNR